MKKSWKVVFRKSAVMTLCLRSGDGPAFLELFLLCRLAISVAAQSTKFPKVDRLNRAEK